MLKRELIVSLLIIGLATSAQATFLGQMRSAETSGLGSLNLMTQAGVFEDARLIGGTARYGIASPVDISGTLAIMDHDASDNVAWMLGGDVQYRLTYVELGDPLDMAIGGIAEYYSLDLGSPNGFSNLGLGLNFVASRPVKLENGFNFTPYGRLNVRVDRNHSKVGPADGSGRYTTNTDSKFNIGFNLGSVFPLSGKVNLVGELQIDEQVGFIAGVNFLMW